MRLTLKVTNAGALAARFFARDRRAQADARRVVRKYSVIQHDYAAALMAFDTGRMLRLLRVTFTADQLAYSLGWRAADFYAEGEPFYPPMVEGGTRKMAAQPSLLPSFELVRRPFGDEMRRTIRRAITRTL